MQCTGGSQTLQSRAPLKASAFPKMGAASHIMATVEHWLRPEIRHEMGTIWPTWGIICFSAPSTSGGVGMSMGKREAGACSSLLCLYPVLHGGLVQEIVQVTSRALLGQRRAGRPLRGTCGETRGASHAGRTRMPEGTLEAWPDGHAHGSRHPWAWHGCGKNIALALPSAD